MATKLKNGFRLPVFILAGVLAVAGLSAVSVSASAAVKYSHKPIIIFNTTIVNTQFGSYPELTAGVAAGVRSLNAKGGVDGSKVILKTCNLQSANVEASCIHEAIADHATAFVGAIFVFNAAGDDALLQKANIANIAPLDLDPTSYSTKDNFPIAAQPFENYACLKAMPGVTGSSTQGYLGVNVPNLTAQNAAFATEATSLGANLALSLAVDPTITDYSSPVAQFQGANVGVITLNVAGPQFASLVTSAASVGAAFDYCTNAGAFKPNELAQLGSSVDGKVYVESSFPALNQTKKYPILKTFESQMHSEGASGDAAANLATAQQQDALNSWLGVQILAQAGVSVHGQITNRTLLSALNKSKDIKLGGLTPNLNFSVAAKGPYSRLFNPKIYTLKWDFSKLSFDPTGVPILNAVSLLK
jgi:hypothetical protein